MKRIVFYLILLLPISLHSQTFKASSKKLPKDINEANLLVTLLVDKDSYEGYKEKLLFHLNTLDLNFNNYMYLDESPQRRDLQLKAVQHASDETFDYVLCFERAPFGPNYIFLLSVIEVKNNDLNEFGAIHQVHAKRFKSLMRRFYSKLDQKLAKEPDDFSEYNYGDKIELDKPGIYPYNIVNKEIEGLPEDIADSKVALLKYDLIPVKPYNPSSFQRMYRKRNELAREANQKLKEDAKDLPIDYGIESRLDYNQLNTLGYKYVLENDLMIEYNEGTNMYAGNSRYYVSEMYLIDLSTQNRYLLDFDISSPYDYGRIINQFIKLLERD